MLLDKKKAPVVVGLGEVLWDSFEDGEHFGGAPANFVCHAAALGARAYMVSAVGDDLRGDQALAILRENGVNVETVEWVNGAPTGTVSVTLGSKGDPAYTITEDAAWDQILWTPAMEKLAERADAVCFGTLAQRNPVSRRTVERFLDSTPSYCLRVFDVNLRGEYYTGDLIKQSLRRATVLKLSDEELPILAKLLNIADGSESERIRHLLARFELTWVVLTRGSRGAIMVGEAGSASADAQPVQVCSTVGAGDSFTAAITIGLLAGNPLSEIILRACRIAEYVCSQPGAVPLLHDRKQIYPEGTLALLFTRK